MLFSAELHILDQSSMVIHTQKFCWYISHGNYILFFLPFHLNSYSLHISLLNVWGLAISIYKFIHVSVTSICII